MKKTYLFAIVAAISFSAIAQAQNVIGRFNYDSLHASYVLCTYGLASNTAGTGQYNNGWSATNSSNFMGPYANVGIIDNGPLEYGYPNNPILGSRHTVHTDTTQLDFNSDSMYKCVPNGYTSAVRLGCAMGSYFCQAIAYDFRVDTSLNDLIVFQFAGTLFNTASHISDQRPRILFELLDSAGNVLGKMDFTTCQAVANSTANPIGLNWLPVPGGYDKYYLDWQSVGLNIRPYHGRNIKFRATTFNCGQGGAEHSGYVYYTAKYGNFSLITLPIVAKSNDITFRAPDGYMKYEWRLDTAPSVIFDTLQTVAIPDGEFFSCTVTDYYGYSKTIQSKAVPRRPHSDFSYKVENPDCNSWILHLNNLAKLIDTKNLTPLPDLEDFVWIIDSNNLCYQRNPVFETTPGWHTIKLVTKSGSTGLSDTLAQRIYVSDSSYVIDTVINVSIISGQSYNFHGRTLTTNGEYYDTTQINGNCFSLEMLKLNVLEGINTADNPEIRIYPNPANSIVNVEGCRISRVEASDNSGRMMALPHSPSQIDVKSLERGIYTLHITTTDGKTAVRRLVKR